MSKNNVGIAHEFYRAMGEKNLIAMEKYVHPHIHFKAPLAHVEGRKAYLETVERFMTFFKSLTLRTIFGSEDQAMVVYDVDFPSPIGHLPSAALLTFQKELIAKVELFYDARPFEK